MVLISLLALVLLLAVAAGLRLLHRRRSLAVLDQEPASHRVVHEFRERTAAMLAPRPLAPDRESAAAENAEWATRPDLQPAHVPDIPATKALVDDRPLGLTVTALATGSVGYPSRDVYYVQRNAIALARGLSAPEVSQQAAALTLSAVMTSPLGRTRDHEKALLDGVRSANRLVRSISQREPQHSGMATTLDVVFAVFDSGQPFLHFAHVGNSSIWLQRAMTMSVRLLTESHAIDGGPLLRAVGMSGNLMPDIGQVPVDAGDRIFLTTASQYFSFTPAIMDAIAIARAGDPLHDCLTALADAVRSSAAPEGVTIVAAEIAHPASFLA
jgi:hypothetical protein